MRRMRIRITEDQESALEAEAAATGRPKAALVRDAIDVWRRGGERGERLKRALTGVGGFRSGLLDVSERHDHYLGQVLDDELAHE